MKGAIYITLEVNVRIELPEDDEKVEETTKDGLIRPTKEAVERAIEAMNTALKQEREIYLDGEENDPVVVYPDYWEPEWDDSHCVRVE